MAEIQPNDIGLATFADVGDVTKLKTAAKTVVGAINEMCQTGKCDIGVLGSQKYVDGENNIVIGENNVVYGNGNFVIGSDNVVVGDNYNLIASGKQIYAPISSVTFSFQSSENLEDKKVSFYVSMSETGQLPFSVGDKALMSATVIWTSFECNDYYSFTSEKTIVQIEEVNTDDGYIIIDSVTVPATAPDDVYTIFVGCEIQTFVLLNDNTKKANTATGSIVMGESSTADKSISFNLANASGTNSLAANAASSAGNNSASFGNSSANGNCGFSANKAFSQSESSAAFNQGYAYSPYSFSTGYYTRSAGRALKCVSLSTTARTITLEEGQIIYGLVGNKILIRCYNKLLNNIVKEATVASVTDNVLQLTGVSFGSGTNAEELFPDKLIFVCDVNTSYGGYNFAGGYYSIGAAKYSLACGNSVAAANESSVIFGKFGTIDSDASFALANGVSLKQPGLAFKALSDGSVHADGEYTSPCADYSEYFEWLDGNENNEDRAGYFVKLEGEKIVKCSDFDTPIGIISAKPAIIGDSGELHWQGKFVTDDFGRIQYHDVVIPEETDDDGNIILEEHTETQPIINPDWNPDREYIPRKNRPEWAPVGVLGKLVVYDDGTLNIGDKCRCGNDGKAVKSINSGYTVLKRISDDKVLVWFKG